MSQWNPGRVLSELADPKTRLAVCRCFFEQAPPPVKDQACVAIAELRRFRPAFLKRQSTDKLADLLAGLITVRSIGDFLAFGLYRFHMTQRKELVCAFLDFCGIAHEDGGVDGDAMPQIPVEKILAAAESLSKERPAADVLFYIASACVCNEGWRQCFGEAADALIARREEARVPEPAPAPETPAAAPDAAPPAEAAKPEPAEAEEESGSLFTPLDDLLTKTIVASVGGVEGAPDVPHTADIIDELIHLNQARPRSYFHRGYFEGLTGAEPAPVVVDNPARRAWRLSGRICALARQRAWAAIADIYENRSGDYEELLASGEGCVLIAAQEVYRALSTLGRWGDAVRSVPPELGLALHTHPLSAGFLTGVLASASNLFRSHKTGEAGILLGYLEACRDLGARRGMKPDPEFIVELMRRRAQCLRAEDNFKGAVGMLEKLIDRFPDHVTAKTWFNLGLAKGGFKFLDDVRVPVQSHDADSMRKRLAAGRDCYLKAAEDPREPLVGALYCLGLEAMLEGKQAEALRHLEKAFSLADNVEFRGQAESTGRRLQAYYAFAILLECVDAQFKIAADLLRKSASEMPKAEWPLWLLDKSLDNAELGLQSGIEVLEWACREFPVVADKHVRDADLLRQSQELQRYVEARASDETRPPKERWEDTLALLNCGLVGGDGEAAAERLDALERLGFEFRALGERMVGLLERPDNYSLAWSEEEALYAQARLCEMEGRLDAAADKLLPVFHRRITNGEFDEAEGVLDHIKSLGLQRDDIAAAGARLEASRPAEEAPGTGAVRDPFEDYLSANGLTVLFVGGDERQEAHDAFLREETAKIHPRLDVRFLHPGWTSNWNKEFDDFKRRAPEADFIVLMPLVRTQFGRSVRAHLSEVGKPWYACTGRGRAFMLRCIHNAARRFVEKKA